jgi:hypothetical protein
MVKILKIYKELIDVVILQEDNGDLKIRARITDDGTPEEQEQIRQLVSGTGFQANFKEEIKGQNK